MVKVKCVLKGLYKNVLKITKGICTILVGMAEILTVGLHALTKLGLHFPVGPVASLLYKFSRHGGGSDDRFEAALAFGHVLLRVEEDDVDFGHVEHPQRHRRAEAERDGEGGGLDVHLETSDGNRERGKVKGRPRRTTSLCSSFLRVSSLSSHNNQRF